MANTTKVVKVQPAKGGKEVYLITNVTGNYVQAVEGANTGEVIAINAADNSVMEPNPTFVADKIGVARPILGHVAGYPCELIAGADKLHQLLKIYKAVGTELDAGAYPQAILDADILLVVSGQ